MTPYGDYQLVRRLAVGGMAEVFLATRGDEPLDDARDVQVVVKRILPHLEDRPQFVRMFLDEARLTAQLAHPNVVQIHDFGQADGVHFIAMEYVDGVSLRDLLAELGGTALPLELCCLVVGDACAGLAYAHAKTGADGAPLGIVHRDVSPDNILLSRDGQVKLADFGIAKASIHLNRTRPGQLKGKLAYMSPEQALLAPVDHRSDLFALGAVLFEVSTGRRLFDAPNDASVLEALLRGDYADPTALVAGYPPDLAAVVRRALAREPEDRFPDAATMAAALGALLPDREAAVALLAHRVTALRARRDAEHAPRGRDAQHTEVAGGGTDPDEGGDTVPGLGPQRADPLAGEADADTIEEAPAISIDPDELQATRPRAVITTAPPTEDDDEELDLDQDRSAEADDDNEDHDHNLADTIERAPVTISPEHVYEADAHTDVVDIKPAVVVPERGFPFIYVGIAAAVVAVIAALIALLT